MWYCSRTTGFWPSGRSKPDLPAQKPWQPYCKAWMWRRPNWGGIASTGGLSRLLPEAFEGVPVHKIGEVQAVGRGALALTGLREALVVSAGTGTAMVAAKEAESQHLTGSAVGGGTLLGLSRLLLGTADPLEVARLAARGNPGKVDSTLLDVIGGGIGHLPPDATAVNLGRLVEGIQSQPRGPGSGLGHAGGSGNRHPGHQCGAGCRAIPDSDCGAPARPKAHSPGLRAGLVFLPARAQAPYCPYVGLGYGLRGSALYGLTFDLN